VNPLWLQNARASRPAIRFVGAVAKFSAIKFLIAEIIAEVSSLRKIMSIDSGILAVGAAGASAHHFVQADCNAECHAVINNICISVYYRHLII
jgi:hypothetical protein